MSAQSESLDAYLKARRELIAEDRGLRSDGAAIAHMSGLEELAEQNIRALRKKEIDNVWKAEHDAIPHVFPGMEFLTARGLIEKSEIFQLLKTMPKGALLHAHIDATVDVRTLLRLAEKEPALHIRIPTKLTLDNYTTVIPQFLALPKHQFVSGTIFGDSYVPDTWIRLQDARSSFPQKLGGEKGFDEWVIRSITINPTEAYVTHNTVEKIWQKFQSCFQAAYGLIHCETVYAGYLRESLLTAINDGISYAELRVTFLDKLMVDKNGELTLAHRDWLIIFESVVAGVKEELKAEGREDQFFGARLIYTTLRFISNEELREALDDCIALKQEFPHLIAGFDLVGDENVLKPLLDYIEPLLEFQQKTKELNLDIPFIFHAGETLGDGDSVDNNLYDALLLGTKRIGHGYSLVKHPHLMKICREQSICLEVCPISNEILRLTSSMPMHPLPILLNHGVPVTLNNDDPSIFGNFGLSYDFFQVLISSEVSGLMTLADIARRSFTYSTLEETQKAQAIALWEKHWKHFVEKVAAFKLDGA
ncbi:adenosine deaminase-related growth [Sistotremastrum niveocremeum HHB9708]|uniref:adenosine deaminase n=2 Tax=Sistotremastraceae TaxID=3402574 RepID=A0A164P571_9AGAM|nr:adenosine deaminase-related growth [Sistotremastrum niveocremeum HHB9708]KZT39709.1 adenosine deaminase-related growth [Sistotremastrum suecicum HHB10207 ss-3]